MHKKYYQIIYFSNHIAYCQKRCQRPKLLELYTLNTTADGCILGQPKSMGGNSQLGKIPFAPTNSQGWVVGGGGGCTAIPFALFRLFFLQRILYGLHTMEVPQNISEVLSTYLLLHCLDAVSFFCIYIYTFITFT